jgi:hypothetical protein
MTTTTFATTVVSGDVFTTGELRAALQSWSSCG